MSLHKYILHINNIIYQSVSLGKEKEFTEQARSN